MRIISLVLLYIITVSKHLFTENANNSVLKTYGEFLKLH